MAFSVADSAWSMPGNVGAVDPRAALVRALAEAVAGASAAGDGKAARVALAALGDLVGDDGAVTSMRDVADERSKQG